MVFFLVLLRLGILSFGRHDPPLVTDVSMLGMVVSSLLDNIVGTIFLRQGRLRAPENESPWT